MRNVADADSVRRQNRGLVLSALRRGGPMSRSQLAVTTGLSNASITAIGSELIAQAILEDGDAYAPPGFRGRPSVPIGFNRHACHAILIELDVNRARLTLIDYAGGPVDRTERELSPDFFATNAPAEFLIDAVRNLRQRNPQTVPTLRHIALSVQGILDREADGLKWSPISQIAGQSLLKPLIDAFGVTTQLHKRGRLLAEGARLLFPEFADQPLAALFMGSTVAMGLSAPGRGVNETGTEFGHMNHVPEGARCRCGMKGCIEAYAADYGLLRTAYGVPDQVPPAARVPASAFQELIQLARSGRRNALHAFNVAGRAIGYGINRLVTVIHPAHIVVTGPGAEAFELMRPEVDAALRESLVCKINGAPSISVLHDEREPIFQGLLADTLSTLDETYFASLAPERRIAANRP